MDNVKPLKSKDGPAMRKLRRGNVLPFDSPTDTQREAMIRDWFDFFMQKAVTPVSPPNDRHTVKAKRSTNPEV